MTETSPQKLFQIAFVCILSLLALLILFSSISVLFFSKKDESFKTVLAPARPEEPISDTIMRSDDSALQQRIVQHYKNKVDAYAQEVTAYSKEVEAYKTYIENEKVNGNTSTYNRQLDAYKTVINNSLLSLFSSIITGIIAWVFATQGLALARSYFDFRQKRVE